MPLQPERAPRPGAFSLTLPPSLPRWREFLDGQLRKVLSRGALRPWDLWELHNPWSRAAPHVESWGFLDICESQELAGCVVDRIGPDVILFDSLIVPNPALPAGSVRECEGALFYPVEPMGGVAVRIPFGEGSAGRGVVLEDPACRGGPDLAASTGAHEYVVRYFPATSRYVRDPLHPKQQRLAESLPWINYCTMPLWLVAGQDRAGNDFATGFNPRPGRWTRARSP
jgi:hypothetical protein